MLMGTGKVLGKLGDGHRSHEPLYLSVPQLSHLSNDVDDFHL